MQVLGLLLGVVAVMQSAKVLIEAWSEYYTFLFAKNRFMPRSLSCLTSCGSIQAWRGTRRFVVIAKVKETADVMSFYLVPEDGKALPTFSAGQYIMLKLNIPNQKEIVTRCYSLSAGPNENHYRITVKRVADGIGSIFLIDNVHPGEVVHVTAPQGRFCLNPDSEKPVVLIAGGIGITPCLSMIDELTQEMQREIVLFYSMKSGKDHVRQNDLQALTDQFPQLRIITIYTSPDDTDILGLDYDGSDRLSIESLDAVLESTHYDFYVCGSKAMSDSVVNMLNEWGVPKESIHSEGFGGPAIAKPILMEAIPAKQVQESEAPKSPTVTFKKSNKTVTWNPAKENILNLAEENGVNVEAVCRSGNCGACQIGLLSGCVKYDQKSDESCDTKSCLPCIAIPVSDIVLNA
ncbi:FAD-binding oxidoreductase [bacterium]|jgi:uncharacterized protein|nr:FAD-binding oxidoreductase [bacterium]